MTYTETRTPDQWRAIREHSDFLKAWNARHVDRATSTTEALPPSDLGRAEAKASNRTVPPSSMPRRSARKVRRKGA